MHTDVVHVLSCDFAQPVEHFVVDHSAWCRRAAGHEDDVRRRRLGDRVRDAEQQRTFFGDDGSDLLADESYLGTGEAGKDFERTDRVECGDAGIKQNRDLQSFSVVIASVDHG